jgi:hypothetical protein
LDDGREKRSYDLPEAEFAMQLADDVGNHSV